MGEYGSNKGEERRESVKERTESKDRSLEEMVVEQSNRVIE